MLLRLLLIVILTMLIGCVVDGRLGRVVAYVFELVGDVQAAEYETAEEHVAERLEAIAPLEEHQTHAHFCSRMLCESLLFFLLAIIRRQKVY